MLKGHSEEDGGEKNITVLFVPRSIRPPSDGLAERKGETCVFEFVKTSLCACTGLWRCEAEQKADAVLDVTSGNETPACSARRRPRRHTTVVMVFLS